MRVKTGWRGREVSGMVDGGSVGGGGGAAEAIGGLGSVEWMRVFVFLLFLLFESSRDWYTCSGMVW